MNMKNKRLYNIWSGIKTRCYNQKCLDYKNYGGNGIKLEQSWLKFENFRDDMSESYERHINKHGQKQTSIDRIDSLKGYSKENCRWATWKTQQNNRTNNTRIYFNRHNFTISQWSDELGLRYGLLIQRIKKGWCVKDILKPVDKPITLFFNGKKQTVFEWSKELGINKQTIFSRLNYGWTVKETLTKPIKLKDK